MSAENAGVALTNSVLKRNVGEIAAEAAELMLDSQLAEGVLKDIPVVGWLVKAGAAFRSLRERLFLKKVALFLCASSQLTEQDRDSFQQRLNDDPALGEQCGEAALLLLDKVAEFGKAQLMGHFFVQFVKGEIDDVILNTGYRLIEGIPLYQILQIPTYYYEQGLGSLSPSFAALYQPYWIIDVFYGDKEKRLHIDPDSGKTFFRSYHQPIYSETPIGRRIAAVVKTYIKQNNIQWIEEEIED